MEWETLYCWFGLEKLCYIQEIENEMAQLTKGNVKMQKKHTNKCVEAKRDECETRRNNH